MISEDKIIGNPNVSKKYLEKYFLGHLLFEFRKSKGINQITMVKALGVDKNKLGKIESNQLPISQKLLNKIQKIWNIDLIQISKDRGNKPKE